MQYEVSTPKEYLQVIEDDWRKKKVLQLREMVLELDPNLSEEISCKMLGYRDDKGFVFHLNAQKHHVGFYVGDASKIDADGSLLKGINVGKGCVRFSKSIDLEKTRMKEFISKALKMWKEGKDIGC